MVQVFLITANVGSVFENVKVGLEIWMKEIILSVTSHNPQFVAIHFQETGGKDYKNGSDVIDIFFRALVDNFAAVDLQLVEGFIDSDASVESEYTALASVYFIRKNLKEVQIWDFQDKEFVPVSPQLARLHSGKDLPLASRMHKEKFPQHFFPNSVWSRKGFLRTRWYIQGTVLELVNIHLFHDSSNLTASSSSPSPFAQNRRRTLTYVLEKLQDEGSSNVARFIFGDFNFRVNTYEVFDILRKESQCTVNEDEAEQFEVDAKSFKVNNLEEKFKHNFHWLRPYDFEASQFDPIMGEFDVNFHPTYPFDESLPDKFMRTRCPAWCDRVLFTQNTLDSISKEFPTEYNLIGGSVCMGDHKPVFLAFELKTLETKSQPDDPSQPLMPNSVNSDISSSNTKLKCGFVSFLRDFSLNHCHSNISTNSNRQSGRTVEKCCFRSSRNSTNNSADSSLRGQAMSNANSIRPVQQNNLLPRDNEIIEENKDTQSVKPIFVFDTDSLKENSTNSRPRSKKVSTSETRSVSAHETKMKCCTCIII